RVEEEGEGKDLNKNFHRTFHHDSNGLGVIKRNARRTCALLCSRATLVLSQLLRLLSFAASGDLSPCSVFISACASVLSSSARYARPRLKCASAYAGLISTARLKASAASLYC